MPKTPDHESLAMAGQNVKKPLMGEHLHQEHHHQHQQLNQQLQKQQQQPRQQQQQQQQHQQQCYFEQCDQKFTRSVDSNGGYGPGKKIINSITTYRLDTSEQWPKRRRSCGKPTSSSSSSTSSATTTTTTTTRYQLASGHLVKTVSDLPEFITIERFRIASYCIAGEPHLCLPQLLRYLKDKFAINRLIEKFEESMINFTTASPKQVDGFIKACALTPDAKTCPLIKRSDADKICLKLYEQCYKGKTNDIFELCSMQRQNSSRHFITKGSGNSYSYGNSSTSSSSGCIARTGPSDNIGNVTSGGERDTDSILALAQAVTSTLMIRVYHRCYGKCVGHYYPSLLLSSKSFCIECINCKKMFSPRRFIGHTHGYSEHDICHWGFNSYNWRYYIRLSSKQTMNNLSQDELDIQFQTLQSAAHFIDNEYIQNADEDDYEFDQTDSENSKLNKIDQNNKETSIQLNWQSTNTTVNHNYYQHNLVDRSNKSTTITRTTNTNTSTAPSSFYPPPPPHPPSMAHYSVPTPYYSAHLEGTSSSLVSSNTMNLETKREIYVCSNLASLLRSKGYNPSHINDIVENTLNLIHKSKSIF